SRVTAAHDGNVVTLEEESIAGCAGRNTAARQGGFAFYSKVAWCCAGSENDRACFKDLVSDMDLLNVAFELYRIHDFHAQVSAETSGLSAHFFHELGAQDALLETRVVFHIGGVHQFATVFKALEDNGV